MLVDFETKLELRVAVVQFLQPTFPATENNVSRFKPWTETNGPKAERSKIPFDMVSVTFRKIVEIFVAVRNSILFVVVAEEIN